MAGCYYMQAAGGQWEVIRKREALEDVIEDPDTSPELAARLSLLDEARDFSVVALGLPDNKSYRTYTDLERDYVVWNVFAAPEFSLTPKQWCFPVAGCVSYRGYFSREDAIAQSGRLADDGYDVAVGGVAAYSTLGNFSDPILSTMMRWDDVDLVAVLFFGSFIVFSFLKIYLLQHSKPVEKPDPRSPIRDVLALAITCGGYFVLVKYHASFAGVPLLP